MLGMAFFKSLVKQHGTRYFEPIGKALHAAGIKQPNPFNPSHAWALKGALGPYASWMMKEYVSPKPRPKLPQMPENLRRHAQFAAEQLQAMPLEISGTMRKHQLKLADRQCRMSLLSLRVQNLITMLCTSLYAAKQDNELIRAAADIACQDLKRAVLTTAPSDRYFRQVTNLGATIVEQGFPGVDIETEPILMKYDK